MESGFLHETKTILKSLVISCPDGMTVDRLNRDYKDTVGCWIPFKKLGYQSLELFLKSLPDTLVLTGHGREAMVGFVSNNKTQHINEMINRQKNTTRDRKTAMRHKPVQNISPQDMWRNQNQIPNQEISRIYCTYNPDPIRVVNGYRPVYLPERNVYCRENVQQVPPKYQFDISNKQPSRSSKQVDVKKPVYSCHGTNSRMYFNKIEENSQPQIRTMEKQNHFKSMRNGRIESSISIDQEKSKKMLSEPRNSKSVLINIQNSNKVTTSNDKLTSNTDDQRQTNCKSNKETVLQDTSKIVFPIKNNVKKEVPLGQKTECQKKPQPRLESNNTVHEEHLLEKTDSNSIMFPNAAKKFSTRKKIAEKIIKCPELPTVLESEALVNPKVNLNNPASVISKVSSVDDIVNSSRYITDPFAQFDSSDNDIDEAVPEFAADYRVFHVDFPENSIPFGKKIPRVQLPKDFVKGAVIGVFISEIHSPFKFWFHPHKENHELDILMCGIESFYEQLGDTELLIPKTCITPGQVCVALYNDMWHRAEILSAVVKNKVKVFFVDYGTVSDVETQHIKYLQNRFAETPMQAIRGSLSHIKPVSQIWQKGAIKEFLSLVAEIFLYAQIVEINEKEATVYMVLCDTNSGQTVQINKLLVDRGFARLDTEWDETKIKENGYRKHHPRDIFPTFEMLETGEYPSLFELEQLLAQGIDYEKITEKIILSNLNNICNTVPIPEGSPSNVNKMSFNLLDTNPFKSDIISEIISLKMFDK